MLDVTIVCFLVGKLFIVTDRKDISVSTLFLPLIHNLPHLLIDRHSARNGLLLCDLAPFENKMLHTSNILNVIVLKRYCITGRLASVENESAEIMVKLGLGILGQLTRSKTKELATLLLG